jgi:hypothetical protein
MPLPLNPCLLLEGLLPQVGGQFSAAVCAVVSAFAIRNV